MDVDGAVMGNDGLEREPTVYVLCGRELEECGDRKVTYVGGSRKCIVVKEGTGHRGGAENGNGDYMHLKNDRQMLMTVEGDMDMRMVFKGNEEHGYLYVGENDRLTRRGHKDGAACEGCTHSCLCVMGGELEYGGDGGVTYELMHPMETHNMRIVDAKAGRVVGGDDLDDDYDRCILPPLMGDSRGIKSRRCSKCSEGGHTRRTCRNLRADFDANYEGDAVEVEDLLDEFSAIHRQVRPRNMEMVQTSFETVVYAL
ncbi:hypothetical protein Cgig2_000463 [Carnegiea gigantea]|uniref:CCHC-type domain-containing protein n=1 Tax=Carnegiea gigantea TaxID=171969 RepID=A0A9Q1K479_9CARY|nr:hypothetical protein Cgig2_000463 [Carnegiea gigantea]